MLTKSIIRAAANVSDAILDAWLPDINKALKEYSITNPKEVAAFTATILHETGNLSRFNENLNYSAQGLANTWPSRYSSTRRAGGAPNALANALNRRPQAIANNAYADRMGNGNEASGDGWRFRGHGLIQNTGKAAAIWLNNTVGKKHNVDFLKDYATLLTNPQYSALAACQYWKDNVQPRVRLSDADHVYMDRVSDCVNIGRPTATQGDSIGFKDRLDKFTKLYKVLKSLPESKTQVLDDINYPDSPPEWKEGRFVEVKDFKGW